MKDCAEDHIRLYIKTVLHRAVVSTCHGASKKKRRFLSKVDFFGALEAYK